MITIAAVIKRNKAYLIRVSNGIKDGKQVFVNYTFHPAPGVTERAARKSAKEFAVMFENLVHSGGYVKGMDATDALCKRCGMTVREFVENHYINGISLHLSPNTCRNYEKVIRQFILLSFGHLPIAQLNEMHMQSFVDFLCTPEARLDKKKGTPLAASTIKRYATVLSSIMTEAWKNHLIEKKPLAEKYIRYPKIAAPELEIYSEEEANVFNAKLLLEDARTRALLCVALSTGVRRAELVALKWSDVDVHERLLSINRSAYKPKGGEQKTILPKSLTGIRRTFLTENALESLRLWRDEQESIRKKSKESAWDEGYIFTDEHGKMMSLYAPTVICSNFQKRHGLRHLKFHGLRHTCGTLMMAQGTDIQTVKAALGHADWETTQRYVHTLKSSLIEAGTNFGKAINYRTCEVN